VSTNAGPPRETLPPVATPITVPATAGALPAPDDPDDPDERPIAVPAADAPPSDARDLVLHIGSGKTGTSSIQFFLHRNRARLAELGHLYPRSPGRRRHFRLSHFVQPDDALDGIPTWNRERFDSPDAFREAFQRQLGTEIKRSGLSHVVLSDEGLYGSPPTALQRLSWLADRLAGHLRLVVYLRRQDDHMVSRYQQVVKLGETRRLANRVRELNLTKTYDYHVRLQTWRRLLEPDEFVIRRFERDSFVNGSLYQDFLDATGIDVRADDLEQVRLMNESLDAEAVEVMRMLNLLRKEDPTTAALLPENHDMVTRLAGDSDGPTLTMPEAFLDEFMAKWEESNQGVARELLGDESGQLFRTPRKTKNTTTEQRLDPDRLEHFLALLELPEQVHAPVRGLVEREAKAPSKAL
jgi:hypothetical protein